jgi:hypothetical protein
MWCFYYLLGYYRTSCCVLRWMAEFTLDPTPTDVSLLWSLMGPFVRGAGNCVLNPCLIGFVLCYCYQFIVRIRSYRCFHIFRPTLRWVVLIKLSIKMTQLEAGISEAILEEPHIQISYITATWITSIRKFMAHHNIQMTVTDTLQVRFNSGNDTCIMDPVKLKRLLSSTATRHQSQ